MESLKPVQLHTLLPPLTVKSKKHYLKFDKDGNAVTKACCYAHKYCKIISIVATEASGESFYVENAACAFSPILPITFHSLPELLSYFQLNSISGHFTLSVKAKLIPKFKVYTTPHHVVHS